MKTIEELIKQEPVFLEEFTSAIDVVAQFHQIYMDSEEYYNPTNEYDERRVEKINSLLETEFKDISILFAVYSTPSYEGYAWVLFEQHGKLFEVNGSHCSCYGLEDQWEPEEIDLKELEHRLVEGYFGESSYSGNFKKELCEFLDVEYV